MTERERLAERIETVGIDASTPGYQLFSFDKHERDLIAAALRSVAPALSEEEIAKIIEEKDAALEEAARVAEQYDGYTVDGSPSVNGAVVATAIRYMKSTKSERAAVALKTAERTGEAK